MPAKPCAKGVSAQTLAFKAAIVSALKNIGAHSCIQIQCFEESLAAIDSAVVVTEFVGVMPSGAADDGINCALTKKSAHRILAALVR